MNAGTPSLDTPNADVAELRQRAVESITLAIELFNRPSAIARFEAVLMMFHHSFEMLLKSVIVKRMGTAFDERRGYSYTFDTCLRLASDKLDLLDEHQRRFLSMLDNLRDSAVHYYQDVSEGILYIFAQASVSLFDRLLRISEGTGLLDLLPHRALPISSIPPSEVGRVVDEAFDGLQDLIREPNVTKQKAIAALRPLLAFKIGGEDKHRRPTNAELEITLENLRAAESWRMVFPEIAKVKFSSEGDGIAVGFKVVKTGDDAIPVRIIKPGDAEEAEGVIIEREINILDKFNMNFNELVSKLGVTNWRTLAMMKEYGVREDSESFRELHVGKTILRRYSKKALDILRSKLDTADQCWEKHGYELTHRNKKRE